MKKELRIKNILFTGPFGSRSNANRSPQEMNVKRKAEEYMKPASTVSDVSVRRREEEEAGDVDCRSDSSINDADLSATLPSI